MIETLNNTIIPKYFEAPLKVLENVTIKNEELSIKALLSNFDKYRHAFVNDTYHKVWFIRSAKVSVSNTFDYFNILKLT